MQRQESAPEDAPRRPSKQRALLPGEDDWRQRHPGAPHIKDEGAATRPDAAGALALEAGACHVWSVPLEQPAHVQAALAAHLSEEEKQHMQALRRPELRSCYAVAHGALRVLLGRYLGVAPRLCRYATGPRGKPMLAGAYPAMAGDNAPAPGARTGPGSEATLHFNMSHAGTQALIAVARGVEVGVDIEQRRDMDDMAGVARTILSHADLELWLALPEAQRVQAFYAIWTRKEAVSKAAGTGLYMDFPGLSVEFRPGCRAAVRRIDATFGKPGEWLLAELDCAPGYSAALAARTPALRVSRHTARMGENSAADAAAWPDPTPPV